jgi:uncharacterized protein
MNDQPLIVPAGGWRAIRLTAGDIFRVTNTHGGQVVDTWAFVPPAGSEYLSMEHSRPALRTIRARPGSDFVSNLRRPVLRFSRDTSPGVHDMTMPPCDPARYDQLGAPGHANCLENLHAALRGSGISAPVTPGPLNLFQASPIHPDGSITFEPSPALPGDLVELEALVDLVAVVSVCPMDIMPINSHRPRDVEVAVIPRRR